MDGPVPERTFIKPGRPRITTTYCLKAHTGHLLKEGEDPFFRTIEESVRWLAQKVPTPLPEAAGQGESFVLEEPGQRLECVSIPEKGVWAVRFSHPDAGMGELRAVPGRTWLSDLSVTKTDRGILFGVLISCSSLPDRDDFVAFIRPGIIKSLADTVGLSQVRPLDGEPWGVRTSAEVGRLFELVFAPERTIPVIVATQPDRSKWTLPGEFPEWTIDCRELARKTLGYAHVACLARDASFEWTDRVGKIWSVFDGAVRTYMPGIDQEKDSPRSHPLAMKDRIYYWRYRDGFGESAFVEEVIAKTRVANPRVQFEWKPLVFLAEARLVQADLRVRELKERLGEKDCEKCIAEFDELREAMQARIDESEESAAEMAALATDYASEADYHRNRGNTLAAALEALRSAMKVPVDDPDEEVPIPHDYEAMPQWVEKNLAGRVELLPRARNALKKARYKGVELVYRALLLLATEYRDMRYGMLSLADFEGCCRELGLEHRPAIREKSAGEQGDEYYVSYPPGTSSRRLLDTHLAKGVSRDERETLRIYFFWDEESSQVIVGWLPSHLDTRCS
ncbi:MAG TPA: hypothetical protein PLM30_02590 [Synergistales bacterium]|jgi:hypothetical protein|nr:hypothetical protein [Synergistales bacterium]